MQRLFRCAGLLLLTLAFALPSHPALPLAQGEGTGGGQDKKADDSKKDTKKSGASATETKSKAKEKVKPDWSSEYIGKLTALDEKDSGRLQFTVQVNYKYPELNTDVQNQISQQNIQLSQQQLQLARAKTAQERQNVANQMVNTARQIEKLQTQLYKVKDVNYDIKCQAADKMRVRKYEAVQKLDPETGEFIKMTKDLLDRAKGHEGYPGYEADAKILKTGQMVKIYLWKESATPTTVLDKAKKDNKKIDDIRDELKNLRYDIIMIYVGSEPAKAKG